MKQVSLLAIFPFFQCSIEKNEQVQYVPSFKVCVDNVVRPIKSEPESDHRFRKN